MPLALVALAAPHVHCLSHRLPCTQGHGPVVGCCFVHCLGTLSLCTHTRLGQIVARTTQHKTLGTWCPVPHQYPPTASVVFSEP